jgi:hypothetical protein
MSFDLYIIKYIVLVCYEKARINEEPETGAIEAALKGNSSGMQVKFEVLDLTYVERSVEPQRDAESNGPTSCPLLERFKRDTIQLLNNYV